MDSNIKILGPEIGYSDLVNVATEIAEEEAAKSPTDYHPLRPSNSGKCERELAYSLMEFMRFSTYDKSPRTAESHRLLNLGNPIETHMIRQMERHLSGFHIRYKQQIVELFRLEAAANPEMNRIVEGSVDLVLWSDVFKCVVDIKSKKEKFSSYQRSDWAEMNENLQTWPEVVQIGPTAYYVDDLPAFIKRLNPFFAENFLQLNTYANTEFLKSRGIDHAAIIQYNKNTSEIREIRFRPSEELFLQVRDKFQRVLDAVAVKVPEAATKDYVLGSMKCAFCPYAKECWEGKNSLKEYFKTFPKKQWPVDITDPTLVELFTQYEAMVGVNKTQETLEQNLVKSLTAQGLEKVRLPNGHIYEIKVYKTKIALKRGKL